MFALLTTNLAESGPLTWDMAKQIIQTQSNLATLAISVLVGVAVLLLAGSWIWHFRLHERELEEALESLKAALTAEGKRDFMELTKRVNDEVEKIKKEIEKNVEERITQFDKNTKEKTTLFDAEKARLFAYAAFQLEDWESTAMWFAEALKGYAKTGQEELLRDSVDLLNGNLAACKKLSESFKQKIKKCLPFIPEILKDEKEQIEDKLKKLPEEITGQSETKPN